MRPLILYHGPNSVAGFTAAWVVRRAYLDAGQDPECVELVYPAAGQPTEISTQVAGRDVVMVDFCTSREQLLDIARAAWRLRVLDHHKSHDEACRGLDFCEFDMHRSGAGMAWDRFFPGQYRRELDS